MTKRLPRDRRVPPAQRPPMRLQARDLDVLRAVHDCRALRGDQIATLFFGSRSTAQYRLQRLFHHEYLDRHFLTQVTGAPGGSPTVYTVGKRGAAALATHCDLDPEDVRRTAGAALSWGFLDHLLAVNDVRVAVTVAARARGWALLAWRDEAAFRADPDTVEVEISPLRTQRKPVLPDGYFCLRVPQGETHCFLEVDRGTEKRAQFAPQIQAYEAYARGGYQARFHTTSLRVLVVTTSARRLATLQRFTREAGGDRKYWFTTLEQVTPATVLTAPIWQRLEGDALHPLIPT